MALGHGIALPFNKGGGLPSLLTDSNVVGRGDYKTLSGALVASWTDLSGLGHHLLQSGADAIKPTLDSVGVHFNGTGQYLKAASFTLVQPETVYLVVRQNTYTQGDYLFDGNTLNSGGVQQYQTTPQLFAYAGAGSSYNANLAVGAWGIIQVVFNGASSSFQIDATTEWTGNLGTANMSGFTLGAAGNNAGLGEISVKGWVIRKVADDATAKATIRNYLKSYYGL